MRTLYPVLLPAMILHSYSAQKSQEIMPVPVIVSVMRLSWINAKVRAIPELEANDLDAELIHEAAIGKIAGEQLIKLMTLGLSEEEAEEMIISGFLK